MRITTSKPEGTILSAIGKYKEFIAPTYGPAGKKVLIVNSEYSHEAVDDGRRSSQAFELEDVLENAVIQYVRETTRKGKDGTTTAGLIMSSLVEEAFRGYDDVLGNTDRHGRSLSLRKGLDEAIKAVRKSSKKLKTRDELYSIAYNSYNDDRIASLVADTVFAVGKDGVISVEDSKSTQTTAETVQGMEIPKGYFSPYLTTAGDVAELSNPSVLVVNGKVNTFAEIAKCLIATDPQTGHKKFANMSVVVVAEGFGDDVLKTCVAYKMMGQLSPVLIEAPGFGNRLDNMTDLAAVLGARVVDGTVVKLADATPEILGACETVRATAEKTVFLGGKGKTKEYVAELRKLAPAIESEKDTLARRIAVIEGGVAVVKVGAYTENEQKAIKAKVENAVNSALIAYRGGVVRGAGQALAEIETSSELLNIALKAPRKQLEENGAQYLDEDAVDPADVVITALEAAVSVAVGLITMGGISTIKREKKEDIRY